MVRRSFMLIAGETSGDLLGAELAPRLRARVTDAEGQPSDDLQPLQSSLEPEFYGAGGPRMAAAGVRLSVDMTEHSVVGLWEVIKQYNHYRRVFRQLFQLAEAREPDVIVLIDFAGFNLRFAHAVRRRTRSLQGTFNNWQPRLVQYVSPQVWASRPRRARQMAQDYDLLLSIFPFEREWYAEHAPDLPVVFTGHPIADRHPAASALTNKLKKGAQSAAAVRGSPHLALLPGSRVAELKHHLPVMRDALSEMRRAKPALRATLVVPDQRLLELARSFRMPGEVHLQAGNLSAVLESADVALASTGTVTLECAWFGVPTVTLYKTSPLTYWVGKRLVLVKFMAMPNLLANEAIYPEFIQDAATGANLARSALELLDNTEKRAAIQARLASVVRSLGPPGASDRAAEAIVRLLEAEPQPLRAFLRR
jgi:lipid-A-disaccharide synthase